MRGSRVMLVLAVLILLPGFTIPAFSQQRWIRTYGGANDEDGCSVQQTADSGYIVAGWTYSYGQGNSDVYLIKTDAAGDTLWTRTYGGADTDAGYSVQQTPDSGYIVAGWTSSYGSGYNDLYLFKTNASGDTLWTMIYGGAGDDFGRSVQQTSDGGYVVAGTTTSYGHGGVDVWLVKTDAAGDTLWTRTYGGTGDDFGRSAQQTSDSGYVIAGFTDSYGHGGADVWLIKTDASGDTLWTRAYGDTSGDWCNSVRRTSDGGYILAGETNSYGSGRADVLLVKTNASGDTLWTMIYGGAGDDDGASVQQTADGGYVVAGYTSSYGSGGDDFYLIKTDANGNVGVAEERRRSQTTGGKLVATVIRDLPQGVAAFDAMGRSVQRPKPGIYFLRTAATAVPQKVLLVE